MTDTTEGPLVKWYVFTDESAKCDVVAEVMARSIPEARMEARRQFTEAGLERFLKQRLFTEKARLFGSLHH